MIDLDLDAIVRPTKTIRFQGREVVVSPPSLEDILMLMSLSSGFDGAEDPTTVLSEIRATLKRMIPDIEMSALGVDHLFAIMKLLMSMATPSDTKALEAQGISVDTEKKIDSSQPESLPDSSTTTQATV